MSGFIPKSRPRRLHGPTFCRGVDWDLRNRRKRGTTCRVDHDSSFIGFLEFVDRELCGCYRRVKPDQLDNAHLHTKHPRVP